MQASSTVWSRAQAFMTTAARPLDQARFAYHFAGGSVEDVYKHLAPFQNADGGFGHALEPDLRLAESSALATSVALQSLRTVQAPADHPLVRNVMRYVVNTYDAVQQRWQIVPASVMDAPHAPWWEFDAELPQRFGQFLANPRAELLGYCYDYSALVPSELIEQLTPAVLTHLERAPDEMEMHDLLCYARLLETRSLPGNVRAPLLAKLTRVVDSVVEREPQRWAEYGLQPLTIVSTPQSPFAALLADVIPANVDFLIAQQHADGSWGPNWTWGGSYPETWPSAEQDWKSALTLSTLQRLHAFRRIEP